MTREDVIKILETEEDFSDIAPEEFEDLDLSGLDSYNWELLLRNQPQLFDKCDKLDEFTAVNWRCLLSDQPQFADKCDWNKLSQVDIECLLKSHPDLEKYIPKK